MNKHRREALKAGGSSTLMLLAAAAGLIKPAWGQTSPAPEWNKAAFDGKSMASVASAFGGAAPTLSNEIQLIIPEIAENGASVPIAVQSNLNKTQAIAFVVEKNPTALAAYFEIGEGADPYVATQIKMVQTAKFSALVKADSKYYYASKEIKVAFDDCA